MIRFIVLIALAATSCCFAVQLPNPAVDFQAKVVINGSTIVSTYVSWSDQKLLTNINNTFELSICEPSNETKVMQWIGSPAACQVRARAESILLGLDTMLRDADSNFD